MFRTQIAAPKLPRALPAFQNSLERRRERVQLLDARLLSTAAPLACDALKAERIPSP